MTTIIGTALVLVVLLIVIALVVLSMRKTKKSGKSLQCGMDCKHCGGHCVEKQ